MSNITHFLASFFFPIVFSIDRGGSLTSDKHERGNLIFSLVFQKKGHVGDDTIRVDSAISVEHTQRDDIRYRSRTEMISQILEAELTYQ